MIIVSLTCGLYFGLQPNEHVHGTEWTYVQKENNKHVKTCNLDGCEGETEDCVFVKSVLTAASCSVNGTAKYTCVCGNGYTETIPAAGHAIVTHAANAATCTADGNILYYECTVCEKYFSDEGGTTEITDKSSVTLSAAGHTIVTRAANAATCIANGNILYYECTVCHKYFSNENGTTEITDKASVVLPAGHLGEMSYAYSASDKHIATCERPNCPGVEEACDYEITEDRRPDCETAGEGTETCTLCDHDRTISLSAGTHSLNSVSATAATETAHGKAAHYKCFKCNSLFADENGNTPVTDADLVLHYYGEWDDGERATCSNTGTVGHYTCPVCNQNFDSEKNVLNSLTEQINPAAHSYGTWQAGTAATCSNTGTLGHYECSLCHENFDASYVKLNDLTEEINPSAHSFGDWDDGTRATCTNTGTLGHYECSLCHENFDASYVKLNSLTEQINPAAHSYGTWQAGTAATCTSTGTVAHYECSLCHKNFNASYAEIGNADFVVAIDSSAHSYGQSYTIGSNGEKVYTCSYNSAHKTSVALSSIAIIDAPEYLIKDGATVGTNGFTVRAVYADNSNETVTDSAALTNNASSATAHTAFPVTFTYYGKTASRSLPIYAKAQTGATKTCANWDTDGGAFLELAQTDAEFTYRFTLNVTAVGSSVWNSWVMKFETSNTSVSATLRADPYLLDNFGRGNGASGSTTGFTWTGSGMNTKGTIDFTVTRARVSDHYRITVTMVKGGSTSTAVIDEPTTNSASMKLYLGGELCTYSYSDVIYYAATPEQSGVRVNATTVEVEYGTALSAVKSFLNVYATYTIGGEEPLSAADYELTCAAYNPQTAGEYTVTVSNNGFTTTVTVKVLAEDAAPTIQRLDYFTPQTVSNQGNFVSGSTQAGGGNILNNYWIPYTKPVSIVNPLKGVAASGYTIHADVNVGSANAWAPLFSIRAAEGANQGFLSIVVNGSNRWQISYNDWNGSYGDVAIRTMSSEKLCLTITISDAGVSVYVGDTRTLTLTDTAWLSVKDFVSSADLFYFYGGSFNDGSATWNGYMDVGFGNLGFYKGCMNDAQVKKLAADPATEDFTITVADTETDIDPLPVTYPSQSLPANKYVNVAVDVEMDKSNWGYFNTHDPAIFKDPNSNYYYVYSTDTNRGTTQTGGIHIRRSLDLITWEYVNTAFRGNYPEPATSHVKANSGSDYIFWAPDIIYLNNKYYLYYCMSQFGTATSYMGVATSTSPAGPFTHLGEIYKSTGTDTSQPNAIDPNVVYDKDGKLWCFYGSFFGGIYAIQLNTSTGLPIAGQGKGTHIAGGEHIAMEGPYVVMEGDYYYLFVSYGNLNSDYNVRVFRCPVSEGITGNYVDSQGYNAKVGASGNAITTANYRLHGNKILGGYKIGDNMGYRAPGHMSVLKDNGKYYMVAHTRTDIMASYNFFISIRQMFFTDDGWCVLNQNEYVGESLQAVNVANVAGTYDAVKTVTGTATETYVNFENDTVANSNTLDAHETLSKTVALNANGTVTGDHGSGTWEITDDYKITITLGSDVYSGFVIAAKDSQGRNVISFTAINQNGAYLFGNCIQP